MATDWSQLTEEEQVQDCVRSHTTYLESLLRDKSLTPPMRIMKIMARNVKFTCKLGKIRRRHASYAEASE